MKKILSLLALVAALALNADVYIIDGKRIEGEVHMIGGMRQLCTDTMCYLLPPDAKPVEDRPQSERPSENASPYQTPQPHPSISPTTNPNTQTPKHPNTHNPTTRNPNTPSPSPKHPNTHNPTTRNPNTPTRLVQGQMGVDDFLAFLDPSAEPSDPADSPFAGKSWPVILLLTLLGGLAMNLTPCVLPMMPINLMVIGKSAARGALYGLGIALAYGALGLLAAVGGLAFGVIQGNPWFNLAIAILFAALSLSLFGVFVLDFSKHRKAASAEDRQKLLFPFVMGVVSAVLAGACVAPILVAVLLLTAEWYAAGHALALGLPFVLGLGMALPWPFAGAGLQVLPKPGAWMGKVEKAFGLIVLGFAVWYARLAWIGFFPSFLETSAEGDTSAVVAFASPADFSLEGLERPVFIDCWATWCKNCTAMDRTTLADERVRKALERFTVVKLQAENINDLTALPLFKDVKGLPAYLIVE